MLKFMKHTEAIAKNPWIIPLEGVEGSNHYVMYVKDGTGLVHHAVEQLIEPAGIVLDFGFEQVVGTAYVVYEVEDTGTGGDCDKCCHNIVINNYPHQ